MPSIVLPSASVSFDCGLAELARLDDLAQEDRLALRVRHLDADVRLAGHAVDADRLGLEREAEVVDESGDARVLDAGVGLELVGGDDRAGADVLDLARDVELLALLGDARGDL